MSTTTSAVPAQPWLQSVGHYISGRGGAGGPATVADGLLLVELITAGAVYDPQQEHLRGPGWVFVHRPGQQTIFRSASDGHYECLTLHIDLDRAPPGPDWPRQFLWDEPESALLFAREMLMASHRRGVDPLVQSQLVWSQLMFRLDQFRRHAQPAGLPPRVAKAVSFLEAHFAQDLSVADLATLVQLSPSHLHARFREHVGVSPHRYLNQVRMRVARHQLVATVEPIHHIARRVGFSNAESFCRAFRRQFDTTAAAYRKRFTVYRGV